MTGLSISLSSVRNIKTVNIEDVGVFTVRRLGPGEEYDLSAKRRRLIKISEELIKIKKNMDDLSNDNDKEEFASKYISKIDKLSDEILQIQKYELDIYKQCFQDDSNGEKTESLINSLAPDERMKLYSKIFDDGTDD